MRYKYLLSLFLCVICNWGYSQSIETGFVKEYKGENAKTPLGGVELNVSGAPSTISDAEGRYELKFAVLKPGEVVKYNEIYKSGFVIFNTEALKAWRISNNKTPFVIVMCKESGFRALKKKFYGLIEKSYKAEYEKQRAATKAAERDVVALQRKLEVLERIYQEKLNNINTYVEVFSRIDHSEMTEIEAEALRLVEEGNIEEGIKKYEELDLEEKAREQLAKLKAGNEIVKAGQETVDAAHTDLLALAEKLKARIGLYEMGGLKYDDKKKKDIAQLVTIYMSFKATFGNVYNNELGKWMVKNDPYNINNLREAAALPSYEGLYALGRVYEYNSIKDETLFDLALDCYKKSETLYNLEDSVNKPLERLNTLPNFSMRVGDIDIYYRIISEGQRTVNICSKSLLEHNAAEGVFAIPSQVMHLGKAYQVIGLDEEAFFNAKKLEKVVIPRSVKSIGRDAFKGTSLKECVFLGDVENIEEGETNRETIPLQTILSIPQNAKKMRNWLLRRELDVRSSEIDSICEDAYMSIANYIISIQSPFSDWGDEIDFYKHLLKKSLNPKSKLYNIGKAHTFYSKIVSLIERVDKEDRIEYYEDFAKDLSDKKSVSFNAEWGRECYEKMILLVEKTEKDNRLDYYQELVDLFADSASIMYNTDRAFEYINKIMKLDEGLEGQCYNFMGHIYLFNQNYSKAKELYSLAYEKKYYLALNQLAYLYAQGMGVNQDLAKAQELIDEAITHIPDDWNLYDSKGEFCLMQGDTVQARLYCDKAIEKIKEAGIRAEDGLSNFKSISNLYNEIYGFEKEDAKNNVDNSVLLQKYIDIAQTISRMEYEKLFNENAISYPEYEEILSIGIIAIQVMIKNKSNEQLQRYNDVYIASAVKWSILTELKYRYEWYRYLYPSYQDLTDSNAYKDYSQGFVSLSIMQNNYQLYRRMTAGNSLFLNNDIIKEGEVIDDCIRSLTFPVGRIIQMSIVEGIMPQNIAIEMNIPIDTLFVYLEKACYNIRERCISRNINTYSLFSKNTKADISHEKLEKLLKIAKLIAAHEYLYYSKKELVNIDFEELLSIGTIAIQVMLKNKTEEQLSKYSDIYIATSVQWAIENELQIRYKFEKNRKFLNSTDPIMGDAENKIAVQVAMHRLVASLVSHKDSVVSILSSYSEKDNTPFSDKDMSLFESFISHIYQLRIITEEITNKHNKDMLNDIVFTEKTVYDIANEYSMSVQDVIDKTSVILNIVKDKLKKNGKWLIR